MNWNLHKVTGSRDTVKTKVAEAKLPADVGAFICSQIDAMGDAVGVRLDTYCQDVGSRMSTTRNIQITLEAVKF